MVSEGLRTHLVSKDWQIEEGDLNDADTKWGLQGYLVTGWAVKQWLGPDGEDNRDDRRELHLPMTEAAYIASLDAKRTYIMISNP